MRVQLKIKWLWAICRRHRFQSIWRLTERHERAEKENRQVTSMCPPSMCPCVHVSRCHWELWKDFRHWAEFRCYCFWYSSRIACPVRCLSQVRSACATDAIRTVRTIASNANGFPIVLHHRTVNAFPIARICCHRCKRCRWCSPIIIITLIPTSTLRTSIPSLLKGKVSFVAFLFPHLTPNLLFVLS